MDHHDLPRGFGRKPRKTPIVRHSFAEGQIVHFSYNGDSYPALVTATTAATCTVRRLRSNDAGTMYGEPMQFRYRAKHYFAGCTVDGPLDRSAMVSVGGTWALHPGYANERNPHF